ncbi:MAG: hypothetical protein EXR99_04805 [Gemmataceae bacterium]|nr:hypothetical protein [Gemmataceae bacterium]
MEVFLNPWYMVAGGALVSAPILIHLINRIRYKRIDWAAMEFLLEAMKRNRRKLILEQMLLLLLRIFLVLLTGFLVARFVGSALGRGAGQAGFHFLLFDDSLSMTDRWAGKAGEETTFKTAQAEIQKMARKIAQSPGAHHLRLALLSDPANPVFEGRLNEQALEDLGRRLEPLKPGFLHRDFSSALERAADYFSSIQVGQKNLHLAGDFRDYDWTTGPNKEKLRQGLDRLLEAGVNLGLMDAAHPFRGENRQVVIHHDNLAISDFRAETRLAAEGVPIEFTVGIHNHGAADKKTFLHAKIDGQEDFSASQPLDSLPAGQRTEKKFSLILTRKNKTGAAGLKASDKGEERDRKLRQDREFARVRVEITEDERTGLLADNAREIVVELRSRVPVLVVDGAGAEGRLPGGDSFHVEYALAAARAYEVEHRTLDELEKADLDIYPTIYLLNLPEIKSEKAIARLRSFVERGGGLVWFPGDRSKPAFYNSLFEKEAGLFPLLLADRPTDALSEAQRADMKQKDEQPKILFPDPNHSAIVGLSKNLGAMRYLLIDRYFQARPRFTWDPTGKEAEEIVLLANRKWNDDKQRESYKERAREFLAKLPYDEPLKEKFQKALRRHERAVKESLAADSQYRAGLALEALLNDPGDPANKEPSLKELWALAEMRTLARQIDEFRKSILFGDPLVVGRRLGQGRVAAVLTPAGTRPTAPGAAESWNEWGAGSPVSWSYPVFLMDLQRYLSSEGGGRNLLVGEEVRLTLDPARYQPRVSGSYQLLEVSGAQGGAPAVPPVKMAEQPLSQKEGGLEFTFTQSMKPGAWLFEFHPNEATGGATPSAEIHAYSFNIDSARESDLRRAANEKLEANRFASDPRAGKVHLWAPGDNYDSLKNRMPDASESPWLYLIFMLALIAEQALAVHLSFHLRGKEGPVAVPGRVSA